MKRTFTISDSQKTLYSSNPAQKDTFKFNHNNLSIQTNHYNKLIQHSLLTKILKKEVNLNLDDNIIETPVVTPKTTKEVQIDIEEELYVIKDKLITRCECDGFVVIKKGLNPDMTLHLKVCDGLKNVKNCDEDGKVEVKENIAMSYQRFDHLPFILDYKDNCIKIKGKYDIENIIITMPLENVYDLEFINDIGETTFEDDRIEWKIKKIEAKKSYCLKLIYYNLPNERIKTGTIDVKFIIENIKSGVDITKVEFKDGQKREVYIRKWLKAMKYEVRT